MRTVIDCMLGCTLKSMLKCMQGYLLVNAGIHAKRTWKYISKCIIGIHAKHIEMHAEMHAEVYPESVLGMCTEMHTRRALWNVS